MLGFLVYTVIRQWTELSEHSVDFSAGWLILALAGLLGFQLLTGGAWLWQLRMLGYSPYPVRTQMAWAKSLLARYVPGGVLFVLTRLVLTEREGVPRRATLAAMVYETALQLAAAAAFAGGIFMLQPEATSVAWLRWLLLGTTPLVLACTHPRFFAPLANRVFRMFGRRDGPPLLEFRRVLMLFSYYVVTWAVIGTGMWCVTRAIYPIDASDWGVVAAAQAVAFCAAVITLVFPGGLGIRDGAFAWALQAAIPGSSFAGAAAVALACRLVLMLSEGLFAAATVAAARWTAKVPQLPRDTTVDILASRDEGEKHTA